MKPCGICSKEWVACKNENIINRDTPIVERNHLMPFTSLYADSKGSYHNFFSLVGVEFRIFMVSPIATITTPVARKLQIWNVDIYCTKTSIRKNTYENPNIVRYMPKNITSY